jgi:hypothetical protein
MGRPWLGDALYEIGLADAETVYLVVDWNR